MVLRIMSSGPFFCTLRLTSFSGSIIKTLKSTKEVVESCIELDSCKVKLDRLQKLKIMCCYVEESI